MDYDLSINIFRAKVTPNVEGRLLLHFEKLHLRIRCRKNLTTCEVPGVRVELIGTGIQVILTCVVHCGPARRCAPVVPLRLDPESARIHFDEAKFSRMRTV